MARFMPAAQRIRHSSTPRPTTETSTMLDKFRSVAALPGHAEQAEGERGRLPHPAPSSPRSA